MYWLGIDFGGTFIKFTSLDASLSPGPIIQRPTPTGQGGEAIIETMVEGAMAYLDDQQLDRDELQAVGVGAPGPLSISRGILLNLPNLPGLENFPIRDRLADRLGVSVALENDANAAAFGEYLCGAGVEQSKIIMLTLGTGVGGGIIYNGQIIHGAHDMGAELGHLIIHPGGRPCGCGQQGCLEAYCSAANIARMATERIEANGHAGPLAERLQANGSIDGRDIEQARQQGDELARAVWDDCCRDLAIGCVDLCRVFDPQRIIFAGGLSNAGDNLLEPVHRHWQNLDWTLLKNHTTLAIAALGSDAGAIGAAGVAMKLPDGGTL